MKTIKPLSMRQQVNLLKDTGILRGEYLEGAESCLEYRKSIVRWLAWIGGGFALLAAVLLSLGAWPLSLGSLAFSLLFLAQIPNEIHNWNSRIKRWFKLQEDWDAIEEKYNPYLEELE